MAEKLKKTFERNQYGKSTFVCRKCGKRTRDTGRGEDGRYCASCTRILETDNSHYDGCHDETPDPGCRICQELAKPTDNPDGNEPTAAGHGYGF